MYFVDHKRTRQRLTLLEELPNDDNDDDDESRDTPAAAGSQQSRQQLPHGTGGARGQVRQPGTKHVTVSTRTSRLSRQRYQVGSSSTTSTSNLYRHGDRAGAGGVAMSTRRGSTFSTGYHQTVR